MIQTIHQNDASVFQLGQQSCVSVSSKGNDRKDTLNIKQQESTHCSKDLYDEIEKDEFVKNMAYKHNTMHSESSKVSTDYGELVEQSLIQVKSLNKVNSNENSAFKQKTENVQLQLLKQRLIFFECNQKNMQMHFEGIITQLTEQLQKKKKRNANMQNQIQSLYMEVKESQKDIQDLRQLITKDSQAQKNSQYQIHPEKKLKSISPEAMSNQKQKKGGSNPKLKKTIMIVKQDQSQKLPRINLSPKDRQITTTRKITIPRN